MRRLFVLVVVVVLATGAGTALLGVRGGRDDPPAGVRATTPAPGPERPAVLETTFEHFDGRVVRLSDWAGSPIVVNFWASWCPPCVSEMATTFQPVHTAVGDRVVFVGLNLQDDPAKAAEVVEMTGVTYELGRDPVGELFTAFGGFGMPTTVFVDESGAVVDIHTGALTRAQLEQLVTRSFSIDTR